MIGITSVRVQWKLLSFNLRKRNATLSKSLHFYYKLDQALINSKHNKDTKRIIEARNYFRKMVGYLGLLPLIPDQQYV